MDQVLDATQRSRLPSSSKLAGAGVRQGLMWFRFGIRGLEVHAQPGYRPISHQLLLRRQPICIEIIRILIFSGDTDSHDATEFACCFLWRNWLTTRKEDDSQTDCSDETAVELQ